MELIDIEKYLIPTIDPISEHLKSYFENLPKVIIAYNYDHCVYWCRHVGLMDIRDVIMISTVSGDAGRKLMGRLLHRSQVFIYETAPMGKYYEDVMRELRSRYVD